MKKPISICFLFCFMVIINAQVNTKQKLNELNQDQLYFALRKSQKTINTGKILIYTGAGVEGLGIAIILVDLLVDFDKGTLDNNTGKVGYITMCCGAGISFVGLPICIGGAIRRHKIRLELAKFNPPGSASINGIGFKMRF